MNKFVNYKVVTFSWEDGGNSKLFTRDNFGCILTFVKFGVINSIFVKINCYDDIYGFSVVGDFVYPCSEEEGIIDLYDLDDMLSTYYNYIISLVEAGDVKVNSIDIIIVESNSTFIAQFIQYFLYNFNKYLF
jgi:hypothetical protein